METIPGLIPAEPQQESDAPPPLSEAYHRTRRWLALSSGILICWEYVGISIVGEEERVKPELTLIAPPVSITGTPVSLRNPEVVPVVILALVLYFSFRLAVEWRQCDAQRRLRTASLVDVTATYVLAVAASLLFVMQQATELRVADFLTPVMALVALGGLVMGTVAFWGAYIGFDKRLRAPHSEDETTSRRSRVRRYLTASAKRACNLAFLIALGFALGFMFLPGAFGITASASTALAATLQFGFVRRRTAFWEEMELREEERAREMHGREASVGAQ